MIDHKISGRLHYDAMHHYTAPATRLHAPPRAFGIPCAPTFLSLPFVSHQPVVILGIHDGEFSLCQGYSSKWVAEAEAAVEERQEHDDALEPVRDFDCYFFDSLTLRGSEIRNPKHEIRNNIEYQMTEIFKRTSRSGWFRAFEH